MNLIYEWWVTFMKMFNFINLLNKLTCVIDNINGIVCKMTFLTVYSRNKINDKFGICYNKLVQHMPNYCRLVRNV